MTTIERLWNKAQSDPEHQEIHEALAGEATLICNHCGGSVTRDGDSGHYLCGNCGCDEYADS